MSEDDIGVCHRRPAHDPARLRSRDLEKVVEIKCCKAYMVLVNFSAELKANLHRERINGRLEREGWPALVTL